MLGGGGPQSTQLGVGPIPIRSDRVLEPGVALGQDTTISKWRLLRSTFYSGETEAPGGLNCSLRPPMEIMQVWIRTQCCCLSSSPNFP